MKSIQQVTDAPVNAGVSTFRDYRAPRGDGETFLQPSLSGATDLIRDNRAILAKHDEFWQSLRRRGRRQLIADAKRYTSAYRDVDWVTDDEDVSIIMAGHQPTLFHPGVWFKNFALSGLAEVNRALAINFVVDNDVTSGSSIRVPTIDHATGAVAYQYVAYDQAGGGVPFEQSTIRDRERFDRFDQHVKEAVQPLISNPCVDELWQHARAAVDRCGVAGCALAQARHALEGDVGLRSLELPLAVVCRSEAFAEFVVSILTELPRFHHCYNDAADLYRQAHGIRSTAHPVPNLAQQDGWLEAPLWIYGNESPVRRAAWIKMENDQLLISDRDARQIRINTADARGAAEQLTDELGPDFKLRPRALLTTIYARTVLSDLFLHGIGGAKYDQLGDMITRSFFGITPPDFMVISATILLPGIETSDLSGQIVSLKRSIRDTFYQPERFADHLPGHDDVIGRKLKLLSSLPPDGHRSGWHREITQINLRLAAQLSSVRATLSQQLAESQKAVAAQAILESREHPFCIYPLDYLCETYRRLMDP